MAFEMVGEADVRLKRTEVIQTLQALGASDIDENDVYAMFPSGLRFYMSERNPPRAPLIEALVKQNWSIGSRFTFRFFTEEIPEGKVKMREFLEELSARTEAFFVVSIDFVIIVALRDESGLKFVEGRV
jgi:hypothetical protein